MVICNSVFIPTEIPHCDWLLNCQDMGRPRFSSKETSLYDAPIKDKLEEVRENGHAHARQNSLKVILS